MTWWRVRLVLEGGPQLGRGEVLDRDQVEGAGLDPGRLLGPVAVQLAAAGRPSPRA